MSDKLAIGQKLYERSKDGRILEKTVTKVGRKLFEIDEARVYKFEIETLRYDDKMYSQHRRQLYLSREEIEEENELNRVKNKVSKSFANWNVPNLTKDEWLQIEKIIFKDEN